MKDNQVITDPEDLESHNADWTKKYVGKSNLMLKPKTTEEVAAILKYCNENKIAVVPQGGNTGLVGGSQPIFDEVILHLGNLKSIIGFDESYGIVSAEAGVILADL